MATMLGFALGGIFMGRIADKYGVFVPLLVGSTMLGTGYIAAAHAVSSWQSIGIGDNRG